MQKMQEQFSAGSEYAVEACEIHSGFRHQSYELGDSRFCTSCARSIPYILYIKSNGSKMTCVVPLR
jgi:hypothetical protein